MRLKMRFEDLLAAFSNSSGAVHHFIDVKENGMVVLCDDDAGEEDFEKMKSERYIALPQRTAHHDLARMELFAYQMDAENFGIVEKFHESLGMRHPFRNFKDLLNRHPEIKVQWLGFEQRAIRNETIDWLCRNNIDLDGQALIPEIGIRELDSEEMGKLPEEIRTMKPRACLKCHGKDFEARLFMVNAGIDNMMIEKEVSRIMGDKYGVMHYGVWSDKNSTILSAAKCLKCGSEEVFSDY